VRSSKLFDEEEMEVEVLDNGISLSQRGWVGVDRNGNVRQAVSRGVDVEDGRPPVSAKPPPRATHAFRETKIIVPQMVVSLVNGQQETFQWGDSIETRPHMHEEESLVVVISKATASQEDMTLAFEGNALSSSRRSGIKDALAASLAPQKMPGAVSTMSLYQQEPSSQNSNLDISREIRKLKDYCRQ
jgi:hypothetical protein